QAHTKDEEKKGNETKTEKEMKQICTTEDGKPKEVGQVFTENYTSPLKAGPTEMEPKMGANWACYGDNDDGGGGST
ncbi:hypothetical protein FRC17_008733, partial [Serendipita sp. 399]